MKRSLLPRRWALLIVALPVVVYLGLTAVGQQSATAQIPQIYLDWQDGPNNWQPPFLPPPYCATWHEISPVFCNTYHQDNYGDNGDGVVSPCDVIVLNGVLYHVDTVGPTVYLDCSGGGTQIMEPVDDTWIEGNPYDTQWFEVYPNFGTIHNVDGWNDGDATATLTVCDLVTIGGQDCHVKRIGCNIRVSRPPTATEQSTWGKVKSLFNF